MKQQHYDLIAIGGGSGGLAVAEKAAQAGKKVAIVESHKLGGTCVNNGCVPKKVMWYAASIAHAVDDAKGFGIDVERTATDWKKLVERRDDFISAINRYWDGHADDSGIERIHGHARFVDASTIAVDGKHYTADHIVIATGGKPIVPNISGAELGIDSDGFFRLESLPQRVAVIGGGYIGVELSGLLRALGAEVSLFALEDRLLANFDPMIGDLLQGEMRRQGIEVNTGFQVNALSRGVKGIDVISSIRRQSKGFDCVIWAVGRRANTDELKLEAAGVEFLPNGLIVADDDSNTNVPGIYAIGDITGKSPLTPVAIAAGRKLADRLFNGEHSRIDHDRIASVVFSRPPVGSIGLTECRARELYDEVTVYRSEFTPMRHALSAHDPKTAMKLVCAGAQQKIVGIHLIGDGVDEMLQGFAVAITMGATKADFDNTIAIHPTSAEELVTMKAPTVDQADCASDNEPLWRKAG